MINDGKYKIINDQLVNINTKEPVPETMPVFIFLAKDKHILDVLAHYADSCCDNALKAGVHNRMNEIRKWQNENADQVKEPD